MRLKNFIVLCGIMGLPLLAMESAWAAYDMRGCIGDGGTYGVAGNIYCTIRINSYWPDSRGVQFTGIRQLSCNYFNYKSGADKFQSTERGYDDPDRTMSKLDPTFSAIYFNDHLPSFTESDKVFKLASINDTPDHAAQKNCHTWDAYAMTDPKSNSEMSVINFCYKGGTDAYDKLMQLGFQQGGGGRDFYIAYSPYNDDPVINLAVPQAQKNNPKYDPKNLGWVIGVYNGPGKVSSPADKYQSNYIKIEDPKGTQSIWMDTNLFECPRPDDPGSCFGPSWGFDCAN